MSAAFFYICEDGYVYPLDTPSNLPGILYRIETSLSRKTDDNTWYTAFVQDKTRQRVLGNVLEWHGIQCRIETEDGFVKREEAKELGLATDGIVRVAHISYKRQQEKPLKFPNARHDGRAGVALMAYLRDLAALGTHSAALPPVAAGIICFSFLTVIRSQWPRRHLPLNQQPPSQPQPSQPRLRRRKSRSTPDPPRCQSIRRADS